MAMDLEKIDRSEKNGPHGRSDDGKKKRMERRAMIWRQYCQWWRLLGSGARGLCPSLWNPFFFSPSDSFFLVFPSLCSSPKSQFSQGHQDVFNRNFKIAGQKFPRETCRPKVRFVYHLHDVVFGNASLAPFLFILFFRTRIFVVLDTLSIEFFYIKSKK